jgi:hypothetical protein
METFPIVEAAGDHCDNAARMNFGQLGTNASGRLYKHAGNNAPFAEQKKL